MKCFKCRKTIKNKNFYGLHATCFQDWFNLPILSDFSHLDLKKSNSYSANSSNIVKTKDSFYHGQYRKFSAKLNSTSYILKVQEQKYPDLPIIEYVCNRIASLLNLHTPKYYLIKYPTEEQNNLKKSPKQGLVTFVTRNFTQDYVGTLHHIYKFLPKGNRHYNCKNIIKVISEQTKKLRDVETFVKICLFDAFIGNCDRHGRNLGIIDTGRDKKLAPMYDNPSLFGILKDELLLAHFNLSGIICTSLSKKPKLLDYIKEFKELKFENTCRKFTKQVIKQFPLIVDEIKISGMSEKRKQAFIAFLKERLADFKKSIKEDI